MASREREFILRTAAQELIRELEDSELELALLAAQLGLPSAYLEVLRIGETGIIHLLVAVRRDGCRDGGEL
jgi:hypothetical protein